MSMILEALRKSEAERQRGRAPGLFVEQRPARTRERSVPVWAWGLGALLVAVLLAWGWREWSRPAPDPLAAPVAESAVPTTPAQITEPSGPAPTEPGAMASITLTPSPPPPRIEPMPATAQATRVEPAPALQPPPAAVAAPAAPAAVAPPPADALPYVPGLAALAASERAALPPLKLSMHVFSDDPAKRFVILDGQRLGQGASPAAGVVLEEIRRDGLVLSVNGQRLLLARP
ncbi:MAG: hypothetical protein DCF27_02005 [Lysobacteraceae bacterium]|nr:MAG: hypothetical protein DCF27_02005 [Xanthomonadaceae bacterium]